MTDKPILPQKDKKTKQNTSTIYQDQADLLLERISLFCIRSAPICHNCHTKTHKKRCSICGTKILGV